MEVMTIQGVKRQAIELDFEGTEAFNVYKLTDGGEVKVKMAVRRICRLLDTQGKPSFLPNGDPEIWIEYSPPIVVPVKWPTR